MFDPRLKFAVVREDPLVELGELFRLGKPDPSVLLVGSGGCTALAVQVAFPGARVLLVDPNPLQHALVEEKVRALADRVPLSRFNVENDEPEGLSERGNFEALFRQLRGFLREFVAPRAVIEAAVAGSAEHRAQLLDAPYWPVAFDLFFSDAMLVTTFGPAAVQHAEPGSYPRYFQRAVEAMLSELGPARNPFLHHLLLGAYGDRARPHFLRTTAPPRFSFQHLLGTLDEVADFGAYDLVHLSNVFDWCAPDGVRSLARRVAAELRPGAVVTVRQLNNRRPVEAAFPGVHFDLQRAELLAAAEMSFFYERVLVGEKR